MCYGCSSAKVADSVLPQEAHGESPELPSVYCYLDIVMVLTQVAIAGAHHFRLVTENDLRSQSRSTQSNEQLQRQIKLSTLPQLLFVSRAVSGKMTQME